MGATERIIQFIEYKGITKYAFCKLLGFSNKFLDNSSNMGTDKACKIIHQFPEINAEWLLTGEGDMIKQEVAIDNNLASNYVSKEAYNDLLERNAKLCKEIGSLENQIETTYIQNNINSILEEIKEEVSQQSIIPKALRKKDVKNV